MVGKQIPVHGQHAFALGALYDERKQQVVLGQSPWSKATLEEKKFTKQIATSNFEVAVAESLHDRCNLMKIEGSLKVGIMCGLISIEGAGKFLNENKISKKISRVALYYEKQTKIEEIPMEVLDKPEYPEIFKNDDATHVIVGVQYGGKAIFDFQKTFNTETEKCDAEGNLKAQIEKIPTVSIEVEGGGKYENNKTDQDTDIHCKYSGDFEVDQLPTTLDDAIQVYKDLPSKLSENDSKAVPMVAWLTPISYFYGEHQQKIATEIDEILLKKCFKFNAEMNDLMATTADLKNENIVQKFPSLLGHLDVFYSTILDPVDTTIKLKLKEIIPETRHGRKDASCIKHLLEEMYQSSYSPPRLKKWLDIKKEEISFLENLTSNLTGKTKIHLCSSEEEHIRKSEEVDYCYKINIKKHDRFLENFEDPLQFKDDPSKPEDEVMNSAFFKQKEEVMRRMADQLKSFSQANQDSNISFHIKEASEGMNDEEPSSISVSIKGKKEEVSCLPTEPTNVQITDIDCNQISISWGQPEFGSEEVEKLHLTYWSEGGEDELVLKLEKSKSQGIIENLSPLTTYNLKASFKTRYGMSPPSAEQSFKTKPAEAPVSLRVEDICRDTVNIKWDQPVKSHPDVIVQSYEIKVKELDTDTGETKEIHRERKISHHNYCVKDLKEKQEYKIYVRALTNMGTTKYSNQTITTLSDTGFPPVLLKNMFKVIQTENFKKVTNTMDIVSQLNELNKEKKNAVKEKVHEAWVGQLVNTTEFAKFVLNLESVIDSASDTDKEVCKGKIKNLLEPLQSKLQSKSHTMRTLVSIIHESTNSEIPERADIEIESVKDFIGVLEKIKSTDNEYNKADLQNAVYKFKNSTILKENELGCIIFCDIMDEALNRHEHFDVDETIKTMKDINEKIIMAEEIKLCCINILTLYLSHKLLSQRKVFDIIKIVDNKKLDQKTISHINRCAQDWDTEKFGKFLDYARMGKENEYFQEVSKKYESHEITSLMRYSRLKHQQKKELFSKNKDMEKILKMIEDLEMEDFIKKRSINLSDLYPVTVSTTEKMDGTPQPLKFLVELFQLDYRCREVGFDALDECSVEENDDKKLLDLDNIDDDAEVQFDQFVEYKGDKNKVRSRRDNVLIALLCCDEFLLQEAFTKMSACHLGIPILMPSRSLNQDNVFHLWASRGIKKNWIETPNNRMDKYKIHEGFVASRDVHTISFIRVGSLSNSKSKILNTYLTVTQGGKEQSIFLTNDEDSKAMLNQGTIETTWYTPEGQKGECLKDLTCIYNLRGDAEEFDKQWTFLETVSSCVVVFNDGKISKKVFQRISEASRNTNYILVKMDTPGGKIYPLKNNKNFLGIMAKDMNMNDVSKAIAENIKFDENVQKKSLMEHSNLAKKSGFHVDELANDCQKAKEMADKFQKMIKDYPDATRKAKILPLQGKLWKDWSYFDKEESQLKHMGLSSPDIYKDTMRVEKTKIRKQQQDCDISKELRFFINTLCTLQGHEQRFFVQWCQLELNRISESILPEVLKNYNKCMERLDEANSKREKGSHDTSMSPKKIEDSIREAKKEVKEVGQQFDLFSMGIEHIFREFGQLYEAHKESSRDNPFDKLPQVMADLMVLGYPLELMDGTVSHVPLKWLHAVFRELETTLGKTSRVTVMSILGIQSTGKSTLLNTMFGAQFAVSSGRCTKGVFLQLLPLKEEYRQVFKCDYILIMDSEGLRSPELADIFTHDNEIATFVTCLANTTILNFWGQTFSKDMSDIIQIAAHAFIRMERVQLKSSFHMVFAGVADITAVDRNKMGVQSVIQEIDRIIKESAENQGKKEILGMKSVFPLCEQLFPKLNFPQFLPSLWQGQMSAPVSRYGEVVKTLRDSLIQSLKPEESSQRRTQTIGDFMTRIADVWRAIKTESFIFSFRNSQAIQIFTSMQEFYDIKMKTMRTFIFDEMSEVGTSIKKENLENITVAQANISKEIRQVHDKAMKKKKEIEETFQEKLKTYENSDMAAKFLPDFLLDIGRQIETWFDLDKEQILSKIRGTIKRKENDNQKRIFNKTITSKAQEAVASFHTKNKAICDTDIDNKFEDLFEDWKKEANKLDKDMLQKKNEKKNVLEESSQNTLFSKASKNLEVNNSTIASKLQHQDNLQQLAQKIVVHSKDLKLKSGWNPLDGIFSNPSKLDIEEACKYKSQFISDFEKEIEKYENDSDANLVRLLDNTLDEVFKLKNVIIVNDWCFTPKYILNLAIYIYAKGKLDLLSILEKQFSKNSLVHYLEKGIQKFRKDFRNDCKAIDMDIRLGNLIFEDILKEVIEMKMKQKLGQLVYEHILESKIFMHKSNMMFYLHKDLLDASWAKVYEFCKDYKKHVADWIENKIQIGCNENDFLENKIKERENTAIDSTIDICQKIFNEAKEYTSSAWFELLKKSLDCYTEQKLLLNAANLENRIANIKNLDTVSRQMIKNLNDYKSNISRCEEVCNPKKFLESLPFNPIEEVMKSRMGCTEQCPFCGSVCASGLSCNDTKLNHVTELHRPQGFTGMNDNDSKKLDRSLCSTSVSTDMRYRGVRGFKEWRNYKDVATDIPDWTIKPQEGEAQEFWQHLFAKHHENIASHLSVNPADIPDGWKTVTKQRALDNLNNMYALKSVIHREE